MTQDDYLKQIDRYQTWQKLPYNIILWLMVSGILILSLPIYLTYNEILDDIGRLEADNGDIVSLVEDTLTPTPSSGDKELVQRLVILHEQQTQLDALEAQLRESHIYWPPIIKAIHDYDQLNINLENISQVERKILINGRGDDDLSISEYVQNLTTSGLFSDVLLEPDMPDIDASAGQVQFSIQVELREDVP